MNSTRAPAASVGFPRLPGGVDDRGHLDPLGGEARVPVDLAQALLAINVIAIFRSRYNIVVHVRSYDEAAAHPQGCPGPGPVMAGRSVGAGAEFGGTAGCASEGAGHRRRLSCGRRSAGAPGDAVQFGRMARASRPPAPSPTAP